MLGAAIVGFAVAGGVLGADAAFWLYALSALYLGLEGRALQGAALARRGRPLADLVCAARLVDRRTRFSCSRSRSAGAAPRAARLLRPAAFGVARGSRTLSRGGPLT